MGLMDIETADSGSAEIEELSRWIIDVDTPNGRLTRLRPVITYSEDKLNTLPVWKDAGSPDPVWLS